MAVHAERGRRRFTVDEYDRMVEAGIFRDDDRLELIRGEMRPRSYMARGPRPDDVLLVVDVSESSLAYDRGEKLALYAEAGVPEYWVVGVGAEAVHVYREPRSSGLRREQRVDRSAEVALVSHPDAIVRVADLFQ